MNLNTKQLAEEIREIGRELNMDTLGRTWELYAPLHQQEPFEGVEIHRDISYGKDERNRLDLFRSSDNGNATRPVLVFVHGGGFVGGDKKSPGTPFYDNVGVWAVRNGLTGVNITHRLAPQHPWPAGIEDLAVAIEWTYKNGAEYGIDTDRVFLMGQSAGAAHAASYIAHPEIYGNKGHGLSGAILMSGIYNIANFEHSGNTRAYFGDDESLYASRSSMTGLEKSTVPLLIALAEHEPELFEHQALSILVKIQQRDRKLPRFVHMIDHNHLSGILHLGLEGDLLGPQILNFIAEVLRGS